MNVDYSGYEGWEMTGKVKTVLLRGQVAIDEGKCFHERHIQMHMRIDTTGKN